ncbi:hypothetical protein [Dyella sp. ASV21]|jgi:4-amino-4-deoxy-L-arabinose transferase-like glycosyltransferase|uniref:hypothetical protein n=1 Tax=Dyella sp. ASV21 TaxID=2795114 RepID=UPI0018EB9A67|nr:hypothetical protein [Dyella sp. ASV21]
MKGDGKYWFGRKRFGIGYGPRTWQGWLATLIYALSMWTLPRVITPAGDHVIRMVLIAVLTVVFLAVFFWKLDTSGPA